MYNVGASASANENAIGNDPSWFDHSRDLLSIINQYSHHMPAPIVGLGHSMGGAQIMYLSHLHPRLFQSLILVEPAVWDTSLWTTEKKASILQARAMAARRDTRPSLQSLQSSLARSPYYQHWDKCALEAVVKYGYTLQADGTLKSTTSVHSDLSMMGRPNFNGFGREGGHDDMTIESRRTAPDIIPRNGWYAPWYRAEPNRLFQMLPNLRPSVLYVVGGKGQNPKFEANAQRLSKTGTEWGGSGGVKLGRVKQVVVPEGGHQMIVDKYLNTVAAEAAEWIKS